MNKVVIKISTEKTIEIANNMSSIIAGMGMMSTIRIDITPTAKAISPWRNMSNMLPSDGNPEAGLADLGCGAGDVSLI